uniref:Uncharacterized protein n=1 Tax=Astyanax mexicanus TaxID=7994 RepID=A0A8B9HTN5_ASTMX
RDDIVHQHNPNTNLSSSQQSLTKRKPVLLVCSSEDVDHVAAMCALASGLQEELRIDVRLAQWALCSTRASLAQLGPAPWLYGQWQEVQQAGGVVLELRESPVFNATLSCLWAGLHGKNSCQGFGLVCFRGLGNSCHIPKDLRGIRRFCLPRDLSNLVHELDLRESSPEGGVKEVSSGWCCWPRLFSKALSLCLFLKHAGHPKKGNGPQMAHGP